MQSLSLYCHFNLSSLKSIDHSCNSESRKRVCMHMCALFFSIEYVSKREHQSKTTITSEVWGWKWISFSSLTPQTGEKTYMHFKPQSRSNEAIWACGHPRVGSAQCSAWRWQVTQRCPGRDLTKQCGHSQRVFWEDICPGCVSSPDHSWDWAQRTDLLLVLVPKCLPHPYVPSVYSELGSLPPE